ncbi:MAG: prepilin-type N-terminal cleavage/methylation domain-containing protein [Planctomycetota bacterium]
MSHYPHRCIRCGFTLLELLVVVAVIALLIGLLAPALHGARRSAGLVGSLANLRQITVAATAYASDNTDLWPILPSHGDARATYEQGVMLDSTITMPFYFEWAYGGKNTASWWGRNAPWFNSFATDRPLNAYLYPALDFTYDGLDLRGSTLQPSQLRNRRATLMSDELRTELDIYRCPGDWATLTRDGNDVVYDDDVGRKQPTRDPSVIGYDDIGTSYMTNRFHIIDLAEERGLDTLDPEVWVVAARAIATTTGIDSARFSWLHDQTMWTVPLFGGEEGLLGNFSETDKGTTAAVDGSSRYVPLTRRRIDPQTGRNRALITREYHLTFSRFR